MGSTSRHAATSSGVATPTVGLATPGVIGSRVRLIGRAVMPDAAEMFASAGLVLVSDVHAGIAGCGADITVVMETRLADATARAGAEGLFGQASALVLIGEDADPFDQVVALERGADEVLCAPIHPKVLVARLRALCRRAAVRTTRSNESRLVVLGRLAVDAKVREVHFAGEPVHVTSAEFDLLWLLASNAGKVVNRNELLRQLRGLVDNEPNRSVDARLYRLRARFERFVDAAAMIKTVRPYGYMLADVDW